MPKNPKPEACTILGTIRAATATCHLCSWVWWPDEDFPGAPFLLKRPSLMCADKDHRALLNPVIEPLEAWLTAS